MCLLRVTNGVFKCRPVNVHLLLCKVTLEDVFSAFTGGFMIEMKHLIINNCYNLIKQFRFINGN